MRRQLVAAIAVFLALTVVCGVVYPLVTTAVGQAFFDDEADGSLVARDGEIVGSRLIGQGFTAPEYFHPRPSAAGDGYDGASSSASNLGPTNPDLIATVTERADAYRAENGLSADVAVPIDAVTASGSGLDPHISVANAELQAERVADARGLTADEVRLAIHDNTEGRALAVLGEASVNVLELNIALDALK